AVLFTLLVTPLASAALGPPGRRAAILGIGYASHLALDLVTVDRTVPQGIPLLWPFSQEPFLSPVPVFTDIHHGASWSAFVNWHNAGAVLTEALLLGVPVLLFCAVRLRHPDSRAAVAADAASTS